MFAKISALQSREFFRDCETKVPRGGRKLCARRYFYFIMIK